MLDPGGRYRAVGLPDRARRPLRDHGFDVLRLGGEHEHVAGRELDLARVADGGQVEQSRPVGPGVPHLAVAQRGQLRSSRDEHDITASAVQLGGERYADAARADDDIPAHSFSLIAMGGRSAPSRSRSRNKTIVAATVRCVTSFSTSCTPPAMLTSSARGAWA